MTIDVDGGPLAPLRALADPLRWSILGLLAREELCVCHLVELFDAPQSLVSHHLRVLREAGLVESERYRYWTYYRLSPVALRELGRELTALADAAPPPASHRRPCC